MEGVRRTAVASDGRDRSKRAPKPVFDRNKQPPAGLVAKNPPPLPKLKHQSYFEFVENTNKKKQLEYQITLDREPPPGFTFVPIGKPALTALCKELSREKDVMIFMVSTSRDYTNELSMHTNRIGHHIREAIVDEARASLGHRHNPRDPASHGAPEPIPKTQEEINAQADAAIRELFPRVPNTDRQQIVDHAFKMGAKFHGEPVVGLIQDISLSRRVQLAVLAHIRHRHTRYDALLRETTWQHARKTVEAVCLDMIVKWRGDEENGRDNLDSILREVVVISDSEEDEESDDDSDELSIISPPRPVQAQKDTGISTVYGVPAPANPGPSYQGRIPPTTTPRSGTRKMPTTPGKTKRNARALRCERKAAKKATRGFQRYQAAWEQAVDRNRHDHGTGDAQPHRFPSKQRSPTNGAFATRQLDHDTPAQPTYPPHREHSNRDVMYLEHARRPETTNPEPVRLDGRYSARMPGLPSDAQVVQIPAQPRGLQPAPVMTRSLTNPPLSGQRNHEPQYQDLLVRSIEAPAPASMTPQFGRPLPTRKHTRHDDPGHSAWYPPPQPYPPTCSTEGTQDGLFKRRRVTSDRDGMAVPPLDSFPPNPTRSYPALDSARTEQDTATRQVYYERRPEPVEARQQLMVVRQPGRSIPQAGNIIEHRRDAHEPPTYNGYRHAEHMPGPRTEYRDAPAPVPRPDDHRGQQYPFPPRHHDNDYHGAHHDGARHEARPFQTPSAQPLFVRTVEPRTMEIQGLGGTHDRRFHARRDTRPPDRWEGESTLRTEYPVRPQSLGPSHEVNRQPPFAPTHYGVAPARPYTQERGWMESSQAQAHLHPISYAGHGRPLTPRSVIVID